MATSRVSARAVKGTSRQGYQSSLVLDMNTRWQLIPAVWTLCVHGGSESVHPKCLRLFPHVAYQRVRRKNGECFFYDVNTQKSHFKPLLFRRSTQQQEVRRNRRKIGHIRRFCTPEKDSRMHTYTEIDTHTRAHTHTHTCTRTRLSFSGLLLILSTRLSFCGILVFNF